MKKIFNDEQVAYIKANYQTMSYSEIAKNLGNYTERQVRGKINGLGLSKLRKFYDTYFHHIDTPTKAYWLGFLFADGYLIHRPTSRNYELGIELQAQDEYILKALADELGGQHKITHKSSDKEFNGYHYHTETAVLRVYSKQIVTDLINHGVVPNKTNSAIFPRCEHFFQDFVRGYLDGDGCIYIDYTGTSPHTHVSFTCSNDAFLSMTRDLIESAIGITGHIYKEKAKKYRLVYFKDSDIPTLLNWIYYDQTATMLIRKRDKCHEALGLAA